MKLLNMFRAPTGDDDAAEPPALQLRLSKWEFVAGAVFAYLGVQLQQRAQTFARVVCAPAYVEFVRADRREELTAALSDLDTLAAAAAAEPEPEPAVGGEQHDMPLVSEAGDVLVVGCPYSGCEWSVRVQLPTDDASAVIAAEWQLHLSADHRYEPASA